MKHNVQVIDHGDEVLCDDCNKKWTKDMPGTGGILFGSKAICPECAPRWVRSAQRYGELYYIKGHQPPDKSFWAWVMEDLRKGNNTTTIHTWTP